jgi:hypothetical protein
VLLLLQADAKWKKAIKARESEAKEPPTVKPINSPSAVPFMLTVCTRTFNLLIRSLLDTSNVDLTLSNILGLLRDEAKREELSPRNKRWLADFEASWGGLETLATQANAHDSKFAVAAAALGQLSGLMVRARLWPTHHHLS